MADKEIQGLKISMEVVGNSKALEEEDRGEKGTKPLMEEEDKALETLMKQKTWKSIMLN